MRSTSSYYIVGAFEDLSFDAFPTHATPIVVERAPNGYRRWSYVIERPYQIRLAEPQGDFRESLNDLFPTKTYHTFAPRRWSAGSQLVILTREHVVVTSSRTNLLLRLAVAVLRRPWSTGYFRRALLTARNALER